MKTNHRIVKPIESKFSIIPASNRIVGPKIIRFDSTDIIEEEASKESNCDTLIIRRINTRYRGCSEAKIFANRFSAMRHINKHMLRSDEGAMWLLLCPWLSDVLKPAWEKSANARKQSTKIDADVFQKLYHCYADCIEKAVSEAMEYGTITADSRATYFLGLDGLMVVIQNRVVKTAYFPQFNQSLGTRTARKIITKKDKRERKVRKRAQKKLLSKGPAKRRIFQQGFRSSLKYFADCDSLNRSKKQYLELLHLAESNMPCNFHDWKQAA